MLYVGEKKGISYYLGYKHVSVPERAGGKWLNKEKTKWLNYLDNWVKKSENLTQKEVDNWKQEVKDLFLTKVSTHVGATAVHNWKSSGDTYISDTILDSMFGYTDHIAADTLRNSWDGSTSGLMYVNEDYVNKEFNGAAYDIHKAYTSVLSTMRVPYGKPRIGEYSDMVENRKHEKYIYDYYHTTKVVVKGIKAVKKKGASHVYDQTYLDADKTISNSTNSCIDVLMWDDLLKGYDVTYDDIYTLTWRNKTSPFNSYIKRFHNMLKGLSKIEVGIVKVMLNSLIGKLSVLNEGEEFNNNVFLTSLNTYSILRHHMILTFEHVYGDSLVYINTDGLIWDTDKVSVEEAETKLREVGCLGDEPGQFGREYVGKCKVLSINNYAIKDNKTNESKIVCGATEESRVGLTYEDFYVGNVIKEGYVDHNNNLCDYVIKPAPYKWSENKEKVHVTEKRKEKNMKKKRKKELNKVLKVLNKSKKRKKANKEEKKQAKYQETLNSVDEKLTRLEEKLDFLADVLVSNAMEVPEKVKPPRTRKKPVEKVEELTVKEEEEELTDEEKEELTDEELEKLARQERQLAYEIAHWHSSDWDLA